MGDSTCDVGLLIILLQDIIEFALAILALIMYL
jgi:hypothetical protein